MSEINSRLAKQGLSLKLNQSSFNMFCKYYDIKNQPRFCYTYKLHSQPQYSYSIQAIDFIVDEIKKDPENIIQNLKNNIKKK